MKPPFKFSWEEVSPQRAAKWLEKHNPKNRNLRRHTVIAFAADMTRGAWSPTHQGIAFDTDGNLIDGQHRLAAIVKSGVTLSFLICRDVPKRIAGVKGDVMDAIDRGNARSIADVLKLAHGLKVDANLIAACCAMIGKLAFGSEHPTDRTKKLTLSQTLAVLERYRVGLKFVSENRPSTIGLRPAPICSAIAFAHAAEPKHTEEFYRAFATGVGIDAGSPVLTARNHFLNENFDRGSGRERTRRAEAILHAVYCFIHSLPLPRMPRESEKTQAKYFRERQPENIAAIEQIFPVLDKPVVSATTWKPTPAAAALINSKSMSDRLHGGSRRAAKMQDRIDRGELGSALA